MQVYYYINIKREKKGRKHQVSKYHSKYLGHFSIEKIIQFKKVLYIFNISNFEGIANVFQYFIHHQIFPDTRLFLILYRRQVVSLRHLPQSSVHSVTPSTTCLRYSNKNYVVLQLTEGHTAKPFIIFVME